MIPEEYDMPDGIEYPVAKWSWTMIAGISATLTANLFGCFASAFSEFSTAIAAHVNYQARQKEFESEAAQEIERIVSQ